MRVIRGKYKGRRFTPPKSIKARPTTDFAKESLFNVLENQIEFDDLEVLDLFTGTGNISFEFASRGAKSVVSIDMSIHSIKFINQQTNDWDLPIRSYKSNVFKYLVRPIGTYDLIFADPPYALKHIKLLPELVFKSNVLKPEGLLIIEHGQETDLSNHEFFVEKRTYSRVNFSFFKREL